MRGMTIDAYPVGCGDCRWAQTVSRTGEYEHGARTDREKESGAQPLYPTGDRTNNFYDRPGSSLAGSFSAVTSLGVVDKKTQTFKALGSMTWGYNVDHKGTPHAMTPRLSKPGEQSGSMTVLRQESCTWTITR